MQTLDEFFSIVYSVYICVRVCVLGKVHVFPALSAVRALEHPPSSSVLVQLAAATGKVRIFTKARECETGSRGLGVPGAVHAQVRV